MTTKELSRENKPRKSVSYRPLKKQNNRRLNDRLSPRERLRW